MVENRTLEVGQENTNLGKVEIAPEVIEVIAGIAASEVEGVASMRGNFASGVVEKLGRKNHGKGVKVELDDEGITIVESDENILKVPLGRSILLKVLRLGFEMTKEKLIEELDEIFN